MEMKSLIINGKKYDKFTPGDATDPVYPFKVREMIVAPADEEGVSVYSEFVSGSDQNTPILNFNGTTGDEATILRNVADPAKNLDAANKQYVDNKVSGSAVNLSGATAGQIPQISAVDASGKPTAWKAVDMPSGGSAELPVSSAADSGKLLQVGADGKAKWGDKLPTALKNPAVLTFTGAATGTYDGSEALTINIPEGGSGGSTGGGLRKMGAVSGYIGIPVAQLPQDGTIWMCISSGDNAELYSGTITIEDGNLAANNLIAVSSGSVIQLNQAAIVSAGFAIYGMPAADYVGVWQQTDAQSGGSGGLTAEQKSALDGLLKIAVYTEDASAAYAAFKSAFGIYGSDAYSVTLNLTNVSSSNAATSATAGGSYTTTLTPDDGHSIENVTVVMGGSDITATAYAGGVIAINTVTGNITITATAKTSSDGQLVTSGLQGFFDCRTAQYDNTAAGGKTTISATQGNGVLYAWANNQIGEQDARGFVFASGRKFEYDPAGGTDAADYSGALTIITLGYGDTAGMGFNANNISPYWAFRPTYKTAEGTATAAAKSGSGAKTGYCYCVYRVDGASLKLMMNDEQTTYAGESIDGFAAWDTAVKIGLARQTDAGMHLVAAAIYNRALTDVELTDMRAYMQTLEVSE